MCILLAKTLAIKYMGAHHFIPFIHPPWRHGIQRVSFTGFGGIIYNVLKQRWCTVISCFSMSHYGDIQSSVPCWTVALAWDLLIKMEEWPLQTMTWKGCQPFLFYSLGSTLGLYLLSKSANSFGLGCKVFWSWVTWPIVMETYHVMGLPSQKMFRYIYPENRPSPKKSSLPNTMFQVPC